MVSMNPTVPLPPFASWLQEIASFPSSPFADRIGVVTLDPSSMKLLMWRTVLSVFPGGPGGPGGPV
jgi:hypothetical protein